MFYIKHIAENFPPNLVDAEEMATQLRITTEALLEYAGSGHCPHYSVDNGPPLFHKTETSKWAAKNLIKKCEGKDFPDKLTILSAERPEDILLAPQEIRFLKDLREIPCTVNISGIYFLCHNEELVYIGQARSVLGRISSHVNEGNKQFDRAYFIPVPATSLSDVEGALIRQLKPKLNGVTKHGCICAPAIEEERQLRIVSNITK